MSRPVCRWRWNSEDLSQGELHWVEVMPISSNGSVLKKFVISLTQNSGGLCGACLLMSGPVPSTVRYDCHLIESSQQSCEVDSAMILILQIMKLRLEGEHPCLCFPKAKTQRLPKLRI